MYKQAAATPSPPANIPEVPSTYKDFGHPMYLNWKQTDGWKHPENYAFDEKKWRDFDDEKLLGLPKGLMAKLLPTAMGVISPGLSKFFTPGVRSQAGLYSPTRTIGNPYASADNAMRNNWRGA
jgi:hypothetical protein